MERSAVSNNPARNGLEQTLRPLCARPLDHFRGAKKANRCNEHPVEIG